MLPIQNLWVSWVTWSKRQSCLGEGHRKTFFVKRRSGAPRAPCNRSNAMKYLVLNDQNRPHFEDTWKKMMKSYACNQHTQIATRSFFYTTETGV